MRFYSIEWLQALAAERRDLTRPIETLIFSPAGGRGQRHVRAGTAT